MRSSVSDGDKALRGGSQIVKSPGLENDFVDVQAHLAPWVDGMEENSTETQTLEMNLADFDHHKNFEKQVCLINMSIIETSKFVRFFEMNPHGATSRSS